MPLRRTCGVIETGRTRRDVVRIFGTAALVGTPPCVPTRSTRYPTVRGVVGESRRYGRSGGRRRVPTLRPKRRSSAGHDAYTQCVRETVRRTFVVHPSDNPQPTVPPTQTDHPARKGRHRAPGRFVVHHAPPRDTTRRCLPDPHDGRVGHVATVSTTSASATPYDPPTTDRSGTDGTATNRPTTRKHELDRARRQRF